MLDLLCGICVESFCARGFWGFWVRFRVLAPVLAFFRLSRVVARLFKHGCWGRVCVCVCLCVVCVCSLETLEGSYVFGVTALGFLCSFQELGSVRNPETLNLKMLE